MLTSGLASTRGRSQEDRRKDRVTIVHAQSQTTFVVAAGFIIAAVLAGALSHKADHWLPVHLFLLGGVLTTISGATLLLGVPWCSSPAPHTWIVRTQQMLLGCGVILLAFAREHSWPHVWLMIAGTAVLVSLAMLIVLLITVRVTGPKDRFYPAMDGYVVAIILGILGCYAGILMAISSISGANYAWVRSAHYSTNLLGLVGLIIATTLPYMLATQARMKMSKRATALNVRASIAALSVATLLAGLGMLFEHPAVAGVGYVIYALALIYSMTLYPVMGEKQIRWAGWRIAHLAAGLAWWLGCLVAMAVKAFGGKPIPETVLLVLVVGAFAQILVGSLAYFAPVLRGGGQKGLSTGFRTTRSLPGFIAANIAVLGVIFHSGWVIAVSIGFWFLDGAVRAVVLAVSDLDKQDTAPTEAAAPAAD